MDKKQKIELFLKNIFKFEKFKKSQKEIIDQVIFSNKDILAIMPTGSGKSLCFQLPALVNNNLTIVISPLIALMKDQVDSLRKKGIQAHFLNSTLENYEKKNIYSKLENKKIKLLYVAPESLKNEKLLEYLEKIKIDLVVIDEAHCISTWGQNFRPDYLKIKYLLKKLNNPQILALTATATKQVEKDISLQLNRNLKTIKTSFNRKNLYKEVITLNNEIDKIDYLKNIIKKIQVPAIIFVSYQKTAENISKILQKQNINAEFFHAGIKKEEKNKIQEKFISGEIDIIVATIAFGMGIDKSNIRTVIHYNLPQSVENYFQEIGRAGRDGKTSNCIILVTSDDEEKIKKLISLSFPDKESIENLIYYIKNQKNNPFFSSAKKISYNCAIDEVSTNLILHELEENNAIKIYTNTLCEIKLKLNFQPQNIINKIDPKYKKDLEKIFKLSFFKSKIRKWFLFEDIITQTNINYFRSKKIIQHLEEEKLITIEEEKRKSLFLIKDKINNFNINPLSKHFEEILKENFKKIDKLVESLKNKKCIRKDILKYFDEHLKENCKNCSACLGHVITKNIKKTKKEDYVDINKLKQKDLLNFKNTDKAYITILKAIAIDSSLNDRDIIHVLTKTLKKSHAKWKFKLNSYGVLEKHTNKIEKLKLILNKLLHKKLIQIDIDGFLKLTPKGAKILEIKKQ